MKRNHHLSLVLARFLTIFHIYQDSNQFSRIWSLHGSRILSQINLNLSKYLNFLKFFYRSDIYDMFTAIWDHPRGYSLFSLEKACKKRKLFHGGNYGRIFTASKENFIWCFVNPQLSHTPIWGFVLQNRSMLLTFSENLKTFCQVV